MARCAISTLWLRVRRMTIADIDARLTAAIEAERWAVDQLITTPRRAISRPAIDRLITLARLQGAREEIIAARIGWAALQAIDTDINALIEE